MGDHSQEAAWRICWQPRVEDVRLREKALPGGNGKKKVEYGKRWLVEIAPSAFKRMFGERLYSLKWKNMVQEVRIKVATYNRLVDMGQERCGPKICRACACSKRAGGTM